MQTYFYHLTSTSLNQALFKLMDKIYRQDFKIIIFFDDEKLLSELDQTLWSSGRISFLPHAKDTDPSLDEQKIILTLQPDFNPIGAEILVNLSKIEIDASSYEKLIFVFNGNDHESLSLARKRWKVHKDQNHELHYFKQDEKGNWQNENV